MTYQLTFFSKTRCQKRYIRRQSIYQNIYLNSQEYGISRDAQLRLQWKGERAFLHVQSGQSLLLGKNLYNEECLEHGMQLCLYERGNQECYIFISEEQPKLYPMIKYDILTIRNLRVGCGEENDLMISNSLVSRTHFIMNHEMEGWKIRDCSENGTYVNGERIEEQLLYGGEQIDVFGFEIFFGGVFLGIYQKEGEMRESSKLQLFQPQMYYDMVPQGVRFFHRSPRSISSPEMEHIVIEQPPAKQIEEKKPLFMIIGPSFTMMIPILLGSILAVYSYKSNGTRTGIMMYTGIVTASASAVIGIFWALINICYDKRKNILKEQRRNEVYHIYIKKQEKYIQERQKQIRTEMNMMYQSAVVCAEYSEESQELWSRNLSQKDFLWIRLGVGDKDISHCIEIPQKRFSINEDVLEQLPQKIKDHYGHLFRVPTGINLEQEGIVGIIGQEGMKQAFAISRILLAQITANHCYTEVKIALAFNQEKDGGEWLKYRFLPHIWSSDYNRRYLATNREEAKELFADLLEILRQRGNTESFSIKERKNTHIVLLVSDISYLDGEPILKYVHEDARQCDFTIVTLSDTYENLLNHCGCVIVKGENFDGIHDLRTNHRQSIQFDILSENTMEEMSQRFACIRVKEQEAGGAIPDTLTFFEMYRIQKPEECNILERWENNRTYSSMAALIGYKAGQEKCILDVHEKYHGPHGLIAGTTGSGKSETLQTYMMSLAMNFSPDDIGFFVIDYKGGGMANLFEGLPHMIGAISNLSGNGIRRAMVSIKSENTRRQMLFNQAGVNNINNYTRLVKSGEVELPVPHLFIIVDEFAELKREQPEFMKELISVAQVGRSLGVHLILATQKPAGTVDDNIWSNSKFRICLRVQDKQDSKEMLHKEDAAFLTQSGRGYLQVGNDEIYELFQSGWSGAEYQEDIKQAEDTKMELLSPLAGIKWKKKKKKEEKNSAKVVTQLDAMRDYLHNLALEHGYTRDYRLWIEPIKSPLFLNEIQEKRTDADQENVRVLMGLTDDPEHQQQLPYYIDFTENSNLSIYGMVVSGKSTLLQTLIYGLIQNYTPNEVNLYIADFSNKSLICFQDAPHVGGVVGEDDMADIKKMFYLLQRQLNQRKKLLRGINYNSFRKNCTEPLPASFVIIDNYGGFREKTGEKYETDLMHLIKEGAACGIYVILTANSIGTGGIPGRMQENIPMSIALNLNDKYQYSEVLRTSRIEIMPEEFKGRGLVKIANRILEFQTALAVQEEEEENRLEKIRMFCGEKQKQYPNQRAESIPRIPTKPIWSLYAMRQDVQSMWKSGDWLPYAYDEESAEAYGIDLRQTYCYVVSGKTRTGKKNTLRILMRSVKAMGGQLVVLDSTSGEFAQIAQDLNADYRPTIVQQSCYFKELVPEFVTRNRKKNQLRNEGYEEEEIYNEMKCFPPIFLFLTDAGVFLEEVDQKKDKELDASPFIYNVLEKGKLHNIYIIAAFDVTQHPLVRNTQGGRALLSYQTGVQLGGNVAESSFFDFSYMSFTEQNQSCKAGIGCIPLENDERSIHKIAIPFDKKER